MENEELCLGGIVCERLLMLMLTSRRVSVDQGWLDSECGGQLPWLGPTYDLHRCDRTKQSQSFISGNQLACFIFYPGSTVWAVDSAHCPGLGVCTLPRANITFSNGWHFRPCSDMQLHLGSEEELAPHVGVTAQVVHWTTLCR